MLCRSHAAIPRYIVQYRHAKHFIHIAGHKTTFLSGIFCTSVPNPAGDRCCQVTPLLPELWQVLKGFNLTWRHRYTIPRGLTVIEIPWSRMTTIASIHRFDLHLFGMNTASGAVSKPNLQSNSLFIANFVPHHTPHIPSYHDANIFVVLHSRSLSIYIL